MTDFFDQFIKNRMITTTLQFQFMINGISATVIQVLNDKESIDYMGCYGDIWFGPQLNVDHIRLCIKTLEINDV